MRVLLVLAVLLAGCDKWGRRLDKVEDWKDKICACQDGGCVRATMRDYEAWWSSATGKEKIDGGKIAGGKVDFIAVPDEHAKRYEELRDAIRTCAARKFDGK